MNYRVYRAKNGNIKVAVYINDTMIIKVFPCYEAFQAFRLEANYKLMKGYKHV